MSHSKWFFRQQVYDLIDNISTVGLLAKMETDKADAVEVSGPGYERQQVALTFDEATGTIANTGTITFPLSHGSWGKAVGYGFYDNQGRMRFEVPMVQPVELPMGLRFIVEAGDVQYVVKH